MSGNSVLAAISTSVANLGVGYNVHLVVRTRGNCDALLSQIAERGYHLSTPQAYYTAIGGTDLISPFTLRVEIARPKPGAVLTVYTTDNYEPVLLPVQGEYISVGYVTDAETGPLRRLNLSHWIPLQHSLSVSITQVNPVSYLSGIRPNMSWLPHL